MVFDILNVLNVLNVWSVFSIYLLSIDAYHNDDRKNGSKYYVRYEYI